MISVTVQRPVAAPVERVWSVVTDTSRWADVMSAIERVEVLEGPEFRVGTRWRETRTMMGREATEEMRVTAVDAPRGYTVEADSRGAHYVSTFTLTPTGPASTDVAITFAGHPSGAAMRLLASLTAPLARRQAAKALAADLDDLAAAVERG